GAAEDRSRKLADLHVATQRRRKLLLNFGTEAIHIDEQRQQQNNQQNQGDNNAADDGKAFHGPLRSLPCEMPGMGPKRQKMRKVNTARRSVADEQLRNGTGITKSYSRAARRRILRARPVSASCGRRRRSIHSALRGRSKGHAEARSTRTS